MSSTSDLRPPAAADPPPLAIPPPLPATTTHQEDITTAGQRRVNLIWERTQAVIALTVVIMTLATATYMVINKSGEIPTIFSVAFGTVVGFYFSRTNHAAIGGIGAQPYQKYEGR